jgi:endonuclease-8
VPEGDTIAYAANRMRPVLEGQVPDQIRTPQARHALDRWPARLAGRAITKIDTHGKHLFLRFEGELVLHSHLGMSGVWGVYGPGTRWGRSARRAWIVLSRAGTDVVEFDGPLLELLTEGRTRFDQRLAALGPDVLAAEFDFDRFLARVRADDPTRAIGDALLDQRNVAGIGNIWKAEGCWEAQVDPWRPVARVSDEEVVRIIEAMRPRMQRSAVNGPRAIQPRVYGKRRQPCPRCGTRIEARAGGWARSPSGLARSGPAPRHPAGDANRTTYWCPGCQS